MSILNDAVQYLRGVIMPPRCPICRDKLLPDGPPICTTCQVMAPLTEYHMQEENPMLTQFWGLMPIHHASALVWYIHGGSWQRVIHDIKYRNNYLTARNLGRWWATILQQSPYYREVDIIVPVPLHWRRRMQRTYNQSEYLAQGLAEELNLRVVDNAVRRVRYNESQTYQSTNERWENVEGIFRVTKPHKLNGRHILLVDDVFTTGATIISLGNAILQATEGVTLSVVTLSLSKSRFDKLR